MSISNHVKGAVPLCILIPPVEVSKALGVSENTLQVWRSTGRYNLPYVKVGGRVMYRQEDVESFIEKRLHCHADDAA